jgi:hypothetical protein
MEVGSYPFYAWYIIVFVHFLAIDEWIVSILYVAALPPKNVLETRKEEDLEGRKMPLPQNGLVDPLGIHLNLETR